MASKGGLKSKSLVNRESCPFCDQDLYTRDIHRHVKDFCKQAKKECQGKNLLEECEMRRAKRKGYNLTQAFAKQARRNENPTAAGHAWGRTFERV